MSTLFDNTETVEERVQRLSSLNTSEKCLSWPHLLHHANLEVWGFMPGGDGNRCLFTYPGGMSCQLPRSKEMDVTKDGVRMEYRPPYCDRHWSTAETLEKAAKSSSFSLLSQMLFWIRRDGLLSGRENPTTNSGSLGTSRGIPVLITSPSEAASLAEAYKGVWEEWCTSGNGAVTEQDEAQFAFWANKAAIAERQASSIMQKTNISIQKYLSNLEQMRQATKASSTSTKGV